MRFRNILASSTIVCLSFEGKWLNLYCTKLFTPLKQKKIMFNYLVVIFVGVSSNIPHFMFINPELALHEKENKYWRPWTPRSDPCVLPQAGSPVYICRFIQMFLLYPPSAADLKGEKEISLFFLAFQSKKFCQQIEKDTGGFPLYAHICTILLITMLHDLFPLQLSITRKTLQPFFNPKLGLADF